MGALAAELQTAWQEIDASERRILAALEAQEFTALAPLSGARHECILRFFERFPAEPASAPLRLQLLNELIARNNALLDDSRARLGAAAAGSIQASLARRALGAYREQAS